MNFDEWARRWNLPPEAIMELRYISLCDTSQIPDERSQDSEEAVASRVLLEGGNRGMILLRNNSGAFQNEHEKWVRFGLGNVSKEFNSHYKSSDYIGIYPLYITERYLGRTVGIFTAVETKRANWKFKGDKGEKAQGSFLDIVTTNGGIATFASHSGHLLTALERFLG